MAIEQTDWNDVLSIRIEPRLIALLTAQAELQISCSSDTHVREVLSYWARNDRGPVRVPDGHSLCIRQRPDVGI